MLDLARIKARAADRLAAAAPAAPVATLANPANWLTPAPPISQLATLASIETSAQPSPADPKMEADTFRVSRLRRKGIEGAEAQALIARLQVRDQTQDHRRLCLECARLSGAQGRGWVCTVPKLAQVARELPAVLVTMLQDCPGFKPAAL